MSPFTFKKNQWFIEDCSVLLLAEKFGTPCYVYSKAALTHAYSSFDDAFKDYPHHIHYAVKANSNLAVLNVLARLGAGFDIVSQGELERVMKAGGKPQNIIFSGVGKTKQELERAIAVGVGCMNVESISEMQLLNELGKNISQPIAIALRVNPNIDSKSHPYISTGLKENKFGIPIESTIPIAKELQAGKFKHLKLQGLACHIGSQITDLDPFLAALDTMLKLINELKLNCGIEIESLNMGGGLGISYKDEIPPTPQVYIEALLAKLQTHYLQNNNKKVKIFLEPGRAIAANCGILLTRVHHIKETTDKNFAIVDAGMNDLLRPALYHAYQDIQMVAPKENLTVKNYDIVGPVCETADFLGKHRALALEQGSLLAVFNAGAYGFSMSSNYNSRPRPPEIMVDGQEIYLVRPREEYLGLFSSENMLP